MSIEITDALVLTAVERAVRHEGDAVPTWAVYEHVGVEKRSRAARLVRAQLEALEGSALEHGRRHGIDIWLLTRSGQRRLARLRGKGTVPELPESPQHQAWRHARTLAAERIEGFWLAVRAAVEEASELLDVPRPGPPGPDAPDAVPGPPSDVWFELSDRLRDACRRLGSASYCLWEWREPIDAKADVDDHRDPSDDAYTREERAKRQARRRGRRNTQLWHH
jgi:hypothetical protein